jgi:ABC-type branched-subunit amino acid transport system ATPase component
MTVLENVLVGEHCRLHASVPGAVLPAGLRRRRGGRARERRASCSPSSASGTRKRTLRATCPTAISGDSRIARALATEPRLLLLDEPTAGMNPRETDTLTRLIDSLRRELGLAILLIEHDMEVVMGISDRITVLDYGVRIAEGTPAEIQRHPKVIEGVSGHGLRARSHMLELADVHTYYGNIRALRGVSLTVAQGEIVT